MGSASLKKKKSDHRVMGSGEGSLSGNFKRSQKSHSLTKKPKSGRHVSRNHPNAGIYSIAPGMSLSYKKSRGKKDY